MSITGCNGTCTGVLLDAESRFSFNLTLVLFHNSNKKHFHKGGLIPWNKNNSLF